MNQAYANLARALEGLGARPDQVAKLTVYVVDHQPAKLGVLTGAVTAMAAYRWWARRHQRQEGIAP